MNHDPELQVVELSEYGSTADGLSAHQNHNWIEELLAEERHQHRLNEVSNPPLTHAATYDPREALHGLEMPLAMEDFAEALDQGVVRVHSADDINLAMRHSNMDELLPDTVTSQGLIMDPTNLDEPPNLHTNSLPMLHSSSMVDRETVVSAITKAAAASAMEGKRKMGRKGDGRRPAANVRKWLKVDFQGAVSMMQMGKYRIINKLGVQWRDLRIIDPYLATSYPSAILCRDHALVLNLEFIKAIVTTKYVLVLNPEDPNVHPFVNELKQRIAAGLLHPGPGTADSDHNGEAQANGTLKGDLPNGSLPNGQGPPRLPGSAWSNGRQDLPFELKVLELCLEKVLAYLEKRVSELEGSMKSALDKLTVNISASTLETVRRLKGHQKRLLTKVETIRDLLEQLLDDQEDMHKINLSAMERVGAEQAEQAQREASLRRVSLDRTSLKALATSAALAGTELPSETPNIIYKEDRDGYSDSSSSSSGDSWSSEEEEEMQMVEQLLELYFMQLDNLLNRLQALKEYVDDTEDLINIQLDEHRNQIISINLLITMATVLLSAITAVSGVFGMNLNSRLQESYTTFILVCVISSGLSIVLWLAFCALLWRHKLLNLGSSTKDSGPGVMQTMPAFSRSSEGRLTALRRRLPRFMSCGVAEGDMEKLRG